MMSRTGGTVKRIALLLLVPAALIAAGLQTTPTAPRSGMPMRGQGMTCPMNLEGATIAVADTSTGLALSITTSKPENVAELRRRVEQMATMHAVDQPSPTMMQGQMLPANVKYEPIEKGARLTLTPKDPAKLTEFRKQVRAHVEQMQKGNCSMMQDMMQGMMHGMMGGAKKDTEQKK
jgi:hypothetical protein